MPLSLDDVLSPLASDEFVSHYLGEKFLHLTGPCERFKPLFPWPVLNQMLDTHRFVPPRLRLSQDGKPVSPDLFMKNGQLRAAELTGLLRNGATLIIDAVDEAHAPLKEFAQHLSRRLQSRINVNLYAGWRTSHGFDVHWDSHDVFILQVAGTKHWKIYGATEKYPLKNSVELGKTPPKTEPIWDGILAEGEMLYLPRGWWHVAIPCDEPTLHLTVGIYGPNGVDVVRWISDRLQNDERIRMDVPVMRNASAQATYAAAFRDAIREAVEHPDLIWSFARHWNDNAVARPRFSLPWSATPGVLPPTDAAVMTLLSPRNLEVRPREDGALDIAFNGNLFTFAGAAKPLLDFLASSLPSSISQFYQQFGNQYERETLRDFLAAMATHGIILIHESPATEAAKASQ